MEQSTSNKPKITSIHNVLNEFKKCNGCNRKRKYLNEFQICKSCYKPMTAFIPSGNKVVDDFIKYTLTNRNEMAGKMEFVPYDRFKDIEFIAEGGFSKVYKATWIDGPISYWNHKKQKYDTYGEMKVALKKLHDSRNISSRGLNELKMFYDFTLSMTNYDPYDNDGYYPYINKCYGITQDPITKDFVLIIKYYESGDLTHYLFNDFFNHSWLDKLNILNYIILGLKNLHNANIIHGDIRDGNIFLENNVAIIGDLGLSKSILLYDDNKEIYGVIPFFAPENFTKPIFTKASDIYGFGMIMWELMTGRRPLWDRDHDIGLIHEICNDGLRPPIVTNAPEGYIELMQMCWHHDPKKRPTITDIESKIKYILLIESDNCHDNNPTKIIKSPNIGPITINNQDDAYESRTLDSIISNESTRSLTEIDHYQSDEGSFNDKRKLDNNLVEDEDIKKIRLSENGDDDTQV
ncbi:kinase-like domain-containing protein [Rhizophagus clarus]|uniref:Kinase-like domain-containing protein n=1 Tax=Rhizophagus clarus TaxID=94130 RepID=A0A8H3LUY1_9GLOM|nr:kinase-like domain-containing protein [Rhizophagus clarus]